MSATVRPRRKSVTFKRRGLVTVLGFAEACEREPWPVNIFDCDGCGNRIAAGLRGFDNYYSCEKCEEYDVCNDCKISKNLKTCPHCKAELSFINIQEELQ
mmetsp:Transcript_7140/g.9321  ORF Transcript_7140/g.9321 Transcript_7140/m.9321 type:complete len:100 (-) Transcript_7140:763-1062(-)